MSVAAKAGYSGDSVNSDMVDAIVAHHNHKDTKEEERVYPALKACLKVPKTEEISAQWDKTNAVKNQVADKLAMWGMFGPEVDTVCGVRLGCGFLE